MKLKHIPRHVKRYWPCRYRKKPYSALCPVKVSRGSLARPLVVLSTCMLNAKSAHNMIWNAEWGIFGLWAMLTYNSHWPQLSWPKVVGVKSLKHLGGQSSPIPAIWFFFAGFFEKNWSSVKNIMSVLVGGTFKRHSWWLLDCLRTSFLQRDYRIKAHEVMCHSCRLLGEFSWDFHSTKARSCVWSFGDIFVAQPHLPHRIVLELTKNNPIYSHTPSLD